jgi:hypothetical protein
MSSNTWKTYAVTYRTDAGERANRTIAAETTALLFTQLGDTEVYSIVRIDDETPETLLEYLPMNVARRAVAVAAFYTGGPNA